MSSKIKKPAWLVRIASSLRAIDWRDPAWIFLGIVIVLGLALINRMLPEGILSSSQKLMHVTIEHQKKDITHLDQERDTFASDQFYIDTIDFPAGNSLRHEKLGNYDFSKNFFVRIEGDIEVNVPGEYRMIVASDDGFRLEIGGQLVSQYTNDRPMSETAATVTLEKKRYPFVLTWFQGYGQLGLKAWYEGSCGRRLFGEASPCLQFVPSSKKAN